MKKQNEQQETRFLNKTQEVHYQREFKKANRIYDLYTKKGSGAR